MKELKEEQMLVNMEKENEGTEKCRGRCRRQEGKKEQQLRARGEKGGMEGGTSVNGSGEGKGRESK